MNQASFWSIQLFGNIQVLETDNYATALPCATGNLSILQKFSSAYQHAHLKNKNTICKKCIIFKEFYSQQNYWW